MNVTFIKALIAFLPFATPMHPGKQVQRFADMSKNDYHQARRPDQLK
jgi:hypothetical protein